MIQLRRPPGRCARVGHRGAAALAPENTLESLAAAVADRIHADLQPQRVRVRVRKQGVTWAVYTAVTVERP
jgi:glycerophosphoryl diester phosphodiesterase